MNFQFDCTILGGGINGRLLAWRLAGEGVRVTLYEALSPDGTGTASWVAAAMLSPLSEAATAEPLVSILGKDSLTAWPELLVQLPKPVFFQCKGTLVVWHRRDHAEATIFQRRITRNAPRELLNSSNIEFLDATRLSCLEPELTEIFEQGLLLYPEGQLDNRQLLNSLSAGLEERGVICHYGKAVTRAPVSTKVTIDCRGLGAIGTVPGLYGVRGEIARVHAPGVHLRRPIRMLHPRYPIYIVPKQDDIYVIGATEIESNDRSPVSIRSALELFSAAFSLHSNFGEARILELSSQVRPTLINHRPIISLRGRTIRVNGLYRHGYMLAPSITQLTVHLVKAILAGDCYNTNAFLSWRERTTCPSIFHYCETELV